MIIGLKEIASKLTEEDLVKLNIFYLMISAEEIDISDEPDDIDDIVDTYYDAENSLVSNIQNCAKEIAAWYDTDAFSYEYEDCAENDELEGILFEEEDEPLSHYLYDDEDEEVSDQDENLENIFARNREKNRIFLGL